MILLFSKQGKHTDVLQKFEIFIPLVGELSSPNPYRIEKEILQFLFELRFSEAKQKKTAQGFLCP